MWIRTNVDRSSFDPAGVQNTIDLADSLGGIV